MSRKVEFYTITIYQNGVKTDYSIMKLFRNIKINLLESENNTDRTREFDGRKIRLFSYYESLNNNQIVLPFGRDKGGNKPYGVDKKDRLEEIPRDLYDVNALGYEDVKHCIPIGLNRLIQAAHIDPSLDIIPKITWEYPAGFSDYNTPGKYTFISSDLTNLYEKKLNVTDFTCQESVSIIKTCAKMMVRDALNKM